MAQDTKTKVNVIGLNVELNTINYKKLDSSMPGVSANINQEASLVKTTSNDFTLKVNRSIDVEPKCLFELEVSVLVCFTIDEETIEYFKDKDNDLGEYVNANMSTFVENSNAGSVLSLLISQITSSCGHVPLITPPEIEDESQNADV